MSENNSSTGLPENNPWYAVRTFNCQEQKVSRFFTEKELVHFIPMTYSRVISTEEGQEPSEKPKPVLVPAIHNLLFVQKKGTQLEMLHSLRECAVPISIFRQPGVQQLCEIPARDMLELRMLCDPQFTNSIYMTQAEAEAMVGKEVRVVAGPFKGSTGKLVRKNKQFYFLKSVIGMGVMIRVSRWYCEPIQ